MVTDDGHSERQASAPPSAGGDISPVWVWGLPLAPLTFDQALDRIEALIAARRPSYVITANLHYAMLTARDAALGEVNRGAALVVADGMPLVWASRWRPTRLPGRVAGSDLFPALCERAARNGHRVFFLGGAPGVAAQAADNLRECFAGLQIVGVESPPFRPLTEEEQDELFGRIRAARPDLLFAAFSQPAGEKWMAEHYQTLGVPVCVQIGASIDFVAGRVPRAPRWLQKVGLEWAYRLWREPTRLARRYASNLLFALKMVVSDLTSPFRRSRGSQP